MELSESEVVILKKPANLFRGIEAVGGWMSITNKRIIFNPHKLNIQKQPIEMLYSEILEVSKRNTFYCVPNGIKIKVKTGQQYKFVTWKRNALIKLIDEKIKTM